MFFRLRPAFYFIFTNYGHFVVSSKETTKMHADVCIGM